MKGACASAAGGADSRRLDFPQLCNARDLGGCPTVDGAWTRRHSLVRADDLAQLNAQGLQALSAWGIRTVLDLRWPEEAARYGTPVPCALPQVHYAQISLLTRTEEEWRLRSRDAAKELWKCTVLEHARLELRDVLAFIAAAAEGPLLFHCVAGKDRTGLVAALVLALADTEPAALAEDYAQSTQNLRATYLARYPHVAPERILEALQCPQASAYNMLKFLAAAGGVRAYLGRIGLTEREIGALHARLRD